MRLSAITLPLALGVGGCAPVVIASPPPAPAESAATTGLNPGKVLLLTAGAVSALIVLLLIFEGTTPND
jgi:hypothetical protein